MGGSEPPRHPRELGCTRYRYEHVDGLACGATPSWHTRDPRRHAGAHTAIVDKLDGGSHGLAFSDRSEDQR